MGVEDILAPVSQAQMQQWVKEAVPYTNIALATGRAVLCYDGKGLYPLVDDSAPESIDDVKEFLEMSKDFRGMYASDADGKNQVFFPIYVDEEKVPFRQRHPTAHKAMVIGAVLGTLGLAAFTCGCINIDNNSNEIKEVKYLSGPDGINGTIDDRIIVTTPWDDYSDISYMIKNSSGENFTFLKEKLEKGGYIELSYLDDSIEYQQGKFAYPVVDIQKIMNATEYKPIKEEQERKMKEQQESGNVVGIALIALAGSFCAYCIYSLVKESKKDASKKNDSSKENSSQ